MGLEQDILNDISNQMANEVYFHVMADILVDIGWTSVQLKRFRNNKEAIDINLWVEYNCVGKWKKQSTRFIFEKKQDAEWFILRWQ
jgi:hypothetical protein